MGTNNDDKEMLLLLLKSLKALFIKELPRELVRYIYEIKALVVNGEFPGLPAGKKLSEACEYAINRIVSSEIDKLYSFKVAEPILKELSDVCDKYRRECFDKTFVSLEVLDKNF